MKRKTIPYIYCDRFPPILIEQCGVKWITSFWSCFDFLKVPHGRRRLLSHDSSNSPGLFGHPEAHVTLLSEETSRHKMKLECVGLTCTLALESHLRPNV